MKTKLYFIEINDDRFIDFEKYFLQVSLEKRELIHRFKFDIDKKLSLISDLFVRCIACTELKLNNEELLFNKNSHGKPYLTGTPDFHYNISHTRNAILIGISDQFIGVDVEGIKEADLKIARRFFHKNELAHILLHENQTQAFYEIWTKKEAYIKWLGKGLSLPLNAFDVTSSELSNSLKSFYIEDYLLAVCSESFLDIGDLEIFNENQAVCFISSMFD